MIPRIFAGDTVIICAGGPSLRGFDFKLLANRRVVAINRALEVLPHADVLWWTDARFWRRETAAIEAHGAAYKCTGNLEYQLKELPPYVTQYLFTGAEGFDEFPEHLRHGWNGAYAATHLAVHLGAKRIVLLGVDLMHGGTKDTRNFHSGYEGMPNTGAQTEETFDMWRKSFAGLAPIIAAKGIEVINGSEQSALTVWPRCSIEDALSY